MRAGWIGWLCVAVMLTACSGKDDNKEAPDVSHDTSTVSDAGHDAARPQDTAQPEDVSQPEDDIATPQDVSPDVPDEPDVPAQDCAYPSSDPSCPDGNFGPASFLNTIQVVGDTTCCRDFDGDGVFDNMIGLSLASLAAFGGGDPNANIAAAVQSGELAYLLEFANWSNEEFDASLDVRVLLGADADTDYTDNLAGTGSFLVLPESYENGQPKWRFDQARVEDGRLIATGGTLELFFPGLLDEVQMLIRDVRVEADVVPPATLHAGGNVTFDNGEISGAFDRELFFDSMNEAANACTCLQKNVFTFNSSTNRYICDIDETDTANCQADPNPGCRFLGDRQTCAGLGVISGSADIDLNGDGRNDAFSVGVRFTGVGAKIVGDL